MRALRWGWLFGALWVVGIGIASAQTRPGDDFIQLVDAKAYGESWDTASEFLKQSVSRNEWIAQLKAAREPLGAVVSRTLKASEPQKDPPSAPPGEYLLQSFETSFASGPRPFKETLPLFKGADGHWRAVGYFIR